MSITSNIPIRNIYYMLSYAFQSLQEEGYRKLGMEEFSNGDELFAEILIKGLSSQIKRGLAREYIPLSDELFSLKGKLQFGETVKKNSLLRKRVVCSYDDFSTNTHINQIIKSTLLLLMKSDIKKERKKKIRNLLLYFGDVAHINIHDINWKIQYTRENQTYRMLIYICYLVINRFLQDTNTTSQKTKDFSDKQMDKLYEKFILEYFRKHFPQIKTEAPHIKWQIGTDEDDSMLPIMKTDITMTYGNKVLIIDAKYYSRPTQNYLETEKIRSANMYQIFAYVKNKAVADPQKEVSGMLLYAKTTSDSLEQGESYNITGNKISIMSLNLNCHFSDISKQLNSIAENSFNCKQAI